ncbi:MAG TPA: peptide-methionine (S)-S-oxide reductase MsrA [Gemmatimonadales bacterium]
MPITLALFLAAPLAAQAPTTRSAPARETAVVSGGCFWGIQAVFEHLKGVVQATSGYAGGIERTAQYETVSTGTTGHAESVKVIFDPSVVSYATLLRVFLTVAHDPTELNRQGPDEGTQYRSAIWYVGEEQHRIAQAMIDSLTRSRTWPAPIVTQVAPLTGFFPAEAYHQDYALHHPMDPYIFINDRPKVSHLRDRYPDLFAEEPVRYSH